MNLHIEKAPLSGDVIIPGSKSHTIRAVSIAALALGESHIERPLISHDAEASVAAYRVLGADIVLGDNAWTINGTGGELCARSDIIDVGNSGTTQLVAMGSCALLREGAVTLTGDEQIQRRPAGPLAQALCDLGASARSLRGNGCAPYEISGRLKGGETTIECVTSQYLSSLLINAPLADGDTRIKVSLLNEQPYVEMTLDWLKRQGICVEHDSLYAFSIPGGQQYAPVNRPIPADFSSATFFLAAGALGDNCVTSQGLDIGDTQGDKAVIDYLRAMNADIKVDEEGVTVRGQGLEGCELDLNATPDALPMMAVLGCFAAGTTRLVNVRQARVKETDRIAVMCKELRKLGATISELEDGLVIKQSTLRSAEVDGHGDHRVVMSLAIAGTMIEGTTTIHGSEAASVTYPGFVDSLVAIGGIARQSA